MNSQSLSFQFSSTSLLATIICTLFLFFSIEKLIKFTKNTKNSSPPQVKGAWPIIGHLHLVSSSTTILHKALGDLVDEYGPIFTLKLGREKVIVVSSKDLAKECYTKNDLAMASRPKIMASQYLGFNYAMLGFTPYGTYWREIRKLATLHLLSNHRLDQLGHVRAEEASTFVKGLYMACAKNEPSGAVVDLKKGFLDLTLDVIGRIVVGKKYNKVGQIENIEQEEEEGKVWQEALEEVFHLFGCVVVGDYISWLKWLDIGGHEKAMKRVNKQVDDILQRLIDEHKQRRNCMDGDDGEHDFMDVMLSLLDGANFNGYSCDQVNKATVFNLIAGGSDTTATTLVWAMSLLVNNRKSLNKLQEELDLQIGKNRMVMEKDIPKLTYLQAIVKETLRLYPPSPLSSQHLVVEDCTLGDFLVERGSRVVVNMAKIHHDPSLWPEPNEFRPERFMITHQNVDVKGQHYELLPFGSGRRGCPGATFALQVVHLTLAALLHAFEFSTQDGAPIDMVESPGLSNIKVGPLEVVISPRLPQGLYEE